MKKTYISPTVQTIHIAQSVLLTPVSSPGVGLDASAEAVSASDVEVKGSTPSYNVWNDDWSE